MFFPTYVPRLSFARLIFFPSPLLSANLAFQQFVPCTVLYPTIPTSYLLWCCSIKAPGTHTHTHTHRAFYANHLGFIFSKFNYPTATKKKLHFGHWVGPVFAVSSSPTIVGVTGVRLCEEHVGQYCFVIAAHHLLFFPLLHRQTAPLPLPLTRFIRYSHGWPREGTGRAHFKMRTIPVNDHNGDKRQ